MFPFSPKKYLSETEFNLTWGLFKLNSHWFIAITFREFLL